MRKHKPLLLLLSLLSVTFVLVSGGIIDVSEISLWNLRPDDPYYDNQWNLRSVNVIPAWRYSKGENITIAVIDSGIVFGKDLDPARFVPGYDFVVQPGKEITTAENSIDPNGHGSHVASTIGQTINNKYGFAGISDAKLMPLRVFGRLERTRTARTFTIADAIYYAVKKKVDIINFSSEGEEISDISIEQAIRRANEEGIVVVMAAGNKSQGTVTFPRLTKYEVIEVGAYDEKGKRASYSNYGEKVDVYAPGGSLLVDTKSAENCQQTSLEQVKTIPSGISQVITRRLANSREEVVRTCSGTSSAAPHFSGAASLVKSLFKQKGLTSSEIVEHVILYSASCLEKTESQPTCMEKSLNIGEATELAHQLVSPETEQLDTLKKFIDSFLELGRELVKQGRYKEALNVFPDIEKLGFSSKILPFEDWNRLCFNAAINYGIEGKKDDIRRIMPACDKAVRNLESNKSNYYHSALDSRGIAKVIEGDFSGAIDDFDKVVSFYRNQNYMDPICLKYPQQDRKVWIEKLKKRINPFTIETLKILREQQC